MPKTIEVVAYTFDELSDTAKERAREWFRESLAETGALDQEWFTYDCRELLKDKYGIAASSVTGVLMVYWSLGYCQGDGVAFECSRIDTDALLRANADVAYIVAWAVGSDNPWIDYEFDVAIRNDHRMTHERSMDVEVTLSIEDEGGPFTPYYEDGDAEEDIEKALLEVLADASRECRDNGYAEIEARHSNEYIDEDICANEYLFTESGTRSFTL